MTNTAVRIDRKELPSGEVIDYLDSGKRVLVTVEALGMKREIALRKTDGDYICDTGIKLMSYEDRAGMKACLERLRLACTG